jgi:PAS domain S-box-containing protein
MAAFRALLGADQPIAQHRGINMTQPLRVLILEDNPEDAELLVRQLRRSGFEPDWRRVDTEKDYLANLDGQLDIILSDYAMPQFDGMRALELLKQRELDIPFIMVSGTIGEDIAVQAVKKGAADYLLKDRIARLGPAIEHVLKQKRLREEAKQTERALLASEISYRRLFEAAKEGILILEADTGRISDVNPFLLEMLRFSQGEMIGKSIWEIGPFKDIVSNKDRFVQLQQQGYVRYEDLPLETKDGRQIAVEFASNVYQAGDKKVIQCSIRDVTERKQAEERIGRMQVQLEQTNRDLMKKNEEIQYFYHTLSHELKTPLTSAREFVSIVIDGLAGELNSTQLSYLDIAKQSCTDLAVYINDLLDATRLDTGKMHIELKSASLVAIIQRAMAIMRPVATGRKICLSGELDPNLGEVTVDESRIMQILTNLLNNALKFTLEGGKIIVKLGQDPKSSEYVRISVTDTGCGIPKDQIDNLFNRFYQIKKGDATPQQGVGLGLYLCREMVLLHGGDIWVESAFGKGSTFSFTIPKHATKKATHVLVVDDDCEVREALCLLLENAGFDVATAAGGHEALQLMGQKRPDLVVLDLMMVGLDGPSTLKEIRKKLGPIPVIVYTGFPDSDLMKRALESSPFTLLAKPCPPKLIVETVRRISHDIPPTPVSSGTQRPKPFRKQMQGAKPSNPIKQLQVALDDKDLPLALAAVGSHPSLHSLPAQRKN